VLFKYIIVVFVGLFFFCGWQMSEVTIQEKAGRLSPRTKLYKISINETERKYFVHVPPNYDETENLPVVVIFHGGGGKAKAAMWSTGWIAKADEEGFIAVFPEGTPPDTSRPGRFRGNPQTWNDGSERENLVAAKRNISDIDFVSAMLEKIKTDFKVDERRVYATGFSNGGSMTFRVSRELSESFAAIAPVASDDWMENIIPKRPVPILYITGTADPLNPIDGGEIFLGKKSYGIKTPVAEMIKNLVELHGCSKEPQVIYDKDGDKGVAYRNSQNIESVVLYTLKGHGHYWPGGRSLLPEWVSGKNVSKLNANEIIWDFFEKHSLEK
jgi:polyhydroxybutyrate depolymerase